MIRKALAKLTGYKSGITKTLIEETEDLELLKEILYSNAPSELKKQALGKITDENFLKEIADSLLEQKVIIAALRKIDDEGFLTKIVLKCTNEKNLFKNIALFALIKIRESGTIYKIALSSSSPLIRRKCIERIDDRVLLEKLLKKEQVKKVRKIIAGKLKGKGA